MFHGGIALLLSLLGGDPPSTWSGVEAGVGVGLGVRGRGRGRGRGSVRRRGRDRVIVGVAHGQR